MVKTYCVHPGMVRTDVVRNMPIFLRFGNSIAAPVMLLLQKSPKAGAFTTIYCATSANVNSHSGFYYVNSTKQQANPVSSDADKCRALWKVSERSEREM
tara:strand:+ start:1079 stop:1375 length:297 start_codon:yes stop_codon:yes gene_type:complete